MLLLWVRLLELFWAVVLMLLWATLLLACAATAWLGHWVAAELCSGADAGLNWAELLILGCDASTDASLGYDLGCFHSPNHGENMEFEKWY